MALPLSQLPTEIVREVRARKWLSLFIFMVVSFGVLMAGFLWPYKYQSEVVIFIDDRNIIRPLMEGSAVATEINDQASAARELLWGRSVAEKVATDEKIFGPGAASLEPARLEGRIATIRNNLDVRPRGDTYFSISYMSESPMQAFQVAQRLGQLFIQETNARKRAESRNAYDFIDKQVKSYERQLAQVEARLKKFLSENVEGTEGDANNRLSSLRNQLELAELERAELATRARSLQNELDKVNPTIHQGRSADAYQERINSMELQLDNLRLRYHDTYPDIVILREQLAELRRQRARAMIEQGTDIRSLAGEEVSNPVYQELQAALSKTRANIQTVDTRIRSLNGLLEEQEVRMERIQENKAQYSDLTRDMAVNKQIYDDLLKRRERARVSMHLDVEGQGMNYRINETAQYPLNATGPKFSAFAAAGLFLGLLAPFGLVAGLLQIDPRVRARQQLEDDIGLPVLAELPEVRTPYEKRRDRRVTMVVMFCSITVAVVYLALVAGSLMGVIG